MLAGEYCCMRVIHVLIPIDQQCNACMVVGGGGGEGREILTRESRRERAENRQDGGKDFPASPQVSVSNDKQTNALN